MSSSQDVFVAYGSQSPQLSEAMRVTTAQLNRTGISAISWEDLRVEGAILIDTICDAIDASTAILADVTTLNSNVLFEVGYALAKNKQILLALDETDAGSRKAWSDLMLTTTIGRLDYTANGEKLAGLVAASGVLTSPPSLLESLLSGARPKEADAIFAPSVPHKTGAATTLERFLQRQSSLKLLAANEDLVIAPLKFYAQEIYRSSAAIIHLMGNRTKAAEHNSRASLLAGMVHGLEIPLLLVAEESFTPPLDYRDLLYRYPTAAALQGFVSNWLDNLPKDSTNRRRLGKLDLRVELPIRTFGAYVAEYEREELDEYFVDTNEFREILDNRSKVFVGRKGTGKTATMSQAVAELRRDRRILVVPIKPTSYELAGLIDLLITFKSSSDLEYFLVQLWRYLIFTEIAIRAIKYAEDSPAGVRGDSAIESLSAELGTLNVDTDADMAARLEEAILRLSSETTDTGLSREGIAHALGAQVLTRLVQQLRVALRSYDRVAVVMDNLDKAWERGVDYELMARFLLSLLQSGGRIESEMSRSQRNHPAVNLSLSIFLRTDIYDVMAKHAREPDKIGALTVRWRDGDLLMRVLEERYAARSKGAGSSMWTDLFCAEVRGLPTRDYFLWRTLPRPRDIIFFANESLNTAINRGHAIVRDNDIAFAESQYSKFAYEALLVESEAQGWNLEEALYEFAGRPSTIVESALDELLDGYAEREEIKRWLIRTSFLGIELASGEYTYVEGETDARRTLLSASRVAKARGSERKYRVHPAFRDHLMVSDDDLHIDVGATTD